MYQSQENEIELLLEEKVITDSGKNLRSKIDSILRSIENLTEKKARIVFEIKRQKRSLERKRSELKRVSKSTTARVKLTLENKSIFGPDPSEGTIKSLQRLDSILLQESDRVLNLPDSE